MKIRLVWVGRTRNATIQTLVDDYTGRLSRFATCKIVELQESRRADDAGVLAEEGKRISDALTGANSVMLLDVEGRQLSSHELAKEIEGWQLRSVTEVAFIVGGHLGVAQSIKELADFRWSLSRLTLTHEMARVLLVEQLYRAYTIIRGLPYHK